MRANNNNKKHNMHSGRRMREKGGEIFKWCVNWFQCQVFVAEFHSCVSISDDVSFNQNVKMRKKMPMIVYRPHRLKGVLRHLDVVRSLLGLHRRRSIGYYLCLLMRRG